MLMTEEGSHIVIVLANSILGSGKFAYNLASDAINRIAPDIAISCGKFGIYATTLCLGTVRETGKEEVLEKIAESIPNKQVTTAEKAANIIAFLLSDYANAFNGSTLIADRG